MIHKVPSLCPARGHIKVDSGVPHILCSVHQDDDIFELADLLANIMREQESSVGLERQAWDVMAREVENADTLAGLRAHWQDTLDTKPRASSYRKVLRVALAYCEEACTPLLAHAGV